MSRGTKTVYKYDTIKKKPIPVEIHEDPMNAGVYSMPAGCIEAEPPEAGDYEAVVFNETEDGWATVVDYRKKTYYNTETKAQEKVTDIDTEPDDSWTELVPGVYDVWNSETGAWEESVDMYVEAVIRPMRNIKLNECDLIYCNAEKWSGYTDDEKRAWAEYKQALRDLPENVTAVVEDAASLLPELPASGIRGI